MVKRYRKDQNQSLTFLRQLPARWHGCCFLSLARRHHPKTPPINPSVLLGLSVSLPCLGNIEQFNKRYQEASRISCLLQVPRNVGAQATNLLCSFRNIAPSCTFSHCNPPEPILIKLEFLKRVVQQNKNAARFLAIYIHRTACASSKFVGTGRSGRPSSVNSCCPGDWTAFNNPQQHTR